MINKKQAARRLKLEIFRYNPAEPALQPRMQTFEIDEVPYMSLYLALNQVREEHDPSLQFDFACRSAVCGSCGMLVNGRPGLACKTLTAQLPEHIVLQPLPNFQLVGDLSVDTGLWFRGMSERVRAWIDEREPFDPQAAELPMSDEQAMEVYERDRCIECGCCVAACGVAGVRPEFLGPAGLNRIARFMLDPRDGRSNQQWFDVLASDEGVFGCLGLMACDDICPKELPLREVYAYLRRKTVSTVLSE